MQAMALLETADKYPCSCRQPAPARGHCAALAMKPRSMPFDEPGSALDPEMIKEVPDVMLDLARSEMTLLVVTHARGFAREGADRLVFLDTGEIVEVAAPDTFFDNPEDRPDQAVPGTPSLMASGSRCPGRRT